MRVAVISCSLRPISRSRVLAKQAVEELAALGADAAHYDLRDFDMPFCDAVSDLTPRMAELDAAIRQADAALLAVPIYNFDVNAAAKNLIELTDDAWNNKVVGFLCAAGGQGSYMSVMGLANSLMLDFRCLIIPRFVYARGAAFADDRTENMTVGDDEIRKRIRELAQTTLRLAAALKSS